MHSNTPTPGTGAMITPTIMLGAAQGTYLFRPVALIDRTMPVIDLPNAQPFAIGDGPHDFLCGHCRNVLLRKVEMPKRQRVTMVCGRCRTANLMDATVDGQPRLPMARDVDTSTHVRFYRGKKTVDLVLSFWSRRTKCNPPPIAFRGGRA